jgi:adenine-specific DNA-methyltransferase
LNLNAEYSRTEFSRFLREFCPDFAPDVRSVTIPISARTLAQATLLGSSAKLDLRVFEFAHPGTSDRKVALATDGFRVLKEFACFRALVVFRSTSGTAWRLSLMTATPQIDERGTVFTQLSNPRRFSFALGPDARVLTPTRFLVQKGPVTSIDDLAERFSVEVVNKEFYGRIAALYTELVGGALGQGVPGVLRLPVNEPAVARSHEFAVRLIGRILFCWFLREKRGEDGKPMIPPGVLSLSAATEQSDYYHEVLEPLFFEVLNRRVEDRKQRLRKATFDDVPYLNGGLFSPAEDDYYAPGDSGVVVPDTWIIKLLTVLEQYNFTVDESTSIDVDLSIDPEMLGRIFENLLAEINPETGESARKSTGSFYTPRPIVDYMVNEALLMYLERTTSASPTALRALLSDDLTDDAERPLTKPEADGVIHALSAITVLDPACGSGAFPIGVLQKIVQTLRRVDPDAQLWIQQQVRGAPPEIRRVIEREFKHKNFDYIRKLGIIRQSIYGVDIQPIATEIARLRCFLTLIVDERVDKTLPNHGIEPLPNLDFKFVSANSLLDLNSAAKVRLDPALAGASQAEFFEDEPGIAQLRSLRAEYFSASAAERDAVKLRFLQTQKKMLQRMLNLGGSAERTRGLSAWDPFSHDGTDWFDPEWMFGVSEGFDVVIGNPPYVDSEEMVRSQPDARSQYATSYETATGNWDLYVPFTERGYELLRDKGVLIYITPNKWLAARYGHGLRVYTKDALTLLANLDRIKVFEAGNNPTVFLLTKGLAPNVRIDHMAPNYGIEFQTQVAKASMDSSNFGLLYSRNLPLIAKIATMSRRRVKDAFRVENPFSVAEAYQVKALLREEDGHGSNQLRFCNTGTIAPFRSAWGQKRTTYLGEHFIRPTIGAGEFSSKFPRRFQQSTTPKLIFKGMRYFDSFFDKDGEYVAGKSTIIAIPTSVGDPFGYLALLNSRLVAWYLKEAYGTQGIDGGINFTVKIVEEIPVPDHDEALIGRLADIARELSTATSGRETLTDELNRLVYQAYGLTSDEIAIVDGGQRRRVTASTE